MQEIDFFETGNMSYTQLMMAAEMEVLYFKCMCLCWLHKNSQWKNLKIDTQKEMLCVDRVVLVDPNILDSKSLLLVWGIVRCDCL